MPNNKTVDYRPTRRTLYIANATHAIVNNLAPLLFIVFQTDYHLPYGRLGTLVLINFLTQLAMDALCIKLADRLGYRPLLITAHCFCAGGLILLGLLPRVMAATFPALVIAVMTYAVGGGLLEVLISPVIDNLPVPEDRKASSMAMLHSFYCWGQVAAILVSTLVLQAIGRHNWHFLPLAWAALPLWNMVQMARVPMVQPVAAEKAMGLRCLLRSPVFFVFMLLMLCAGASELTMSQWASLFAEQGLGLSKVVGDILGPCLFGVMMAVGRTIYGIWGKRLSLVHCMAACTVLCLLCYLGATLVPNPVINLVSCAVTGFAVSIMWPGSFSAASARFPLGGTALFAVLALMGDLGCSVGPWFAGWVADRAGTGGVFQRMNQALFGGASGLSVGLLMGAVFPLVMLLTLLASARTTKDSPHH